MSQEAEECVKCGLSRRESINAHLMRSRRLQRTRLCPTRAGRDGQLSSVSVFSVNMEKASAALTHQTLHVPAKQGLLRKQRFYRHPPPL